MAKEPNELKWIESLLPKGEYRRKGMFGGFSYYIGEKIILLTFESPDADRTYRGQSYDFEIWNGCMFSVEREHHEKALKRFPFLVNHPILPKWLYLPLKTEGFDDLVSEVIEQAVKPTGYWGSVPKGKVKKGRISTKTIEVSAKMDTRRPRMFSDEPAENVLSEAKKISDLKNLGKLCEIEFRNAGIKNAKQFITLGWKKALIKLIKFNPKNRHSAFAYMLVGALTNQTWNHISEREKQEVRDFVRSLVQVKPNKPIKKPATKKSVSKSAKKS
jgi:hypothetical protein